MDDYQDNWGIIIVGPDTNKVSTMCVGPKLRFLGLFYESFPLAATYYPEKITNINRTHSTKMVTHITEGMIFHPENPSMQIEEKILNE